MLASFKSLKCQSGTEKKKKTVNSDVQDENSEYKPKSVRPMNASAARRISRWRMEVSPCELKSTESCHIEGAPTGSQGQNLNNATIRKNLTVNIAKEDGTLGVTLRGGMLSNQLSSPVVITHVKQGGPADRHGIIRPGDRLLAVNGVSIQDRTLADAQALLHEALPVFALTIEYDVKHIESVEVGNTPFILEIERSDGAKLGITLQQREDGIIISNIKLGSIADRCGALKEGDEIIAVNCERIDSMTVEEISKLLDRGPLISIEVLPCKLKASLSNNVLFREHDGCTAAVANSTSFTSEDISVLETYGWCSNSSAALTHCEKSHIALCVQNGTFGFDLCDAPNGSVLVAAVHPNTAAERCGCLYPGDRVLAINHRNISLDQISAKEAANLVESGPGGKVNLLIEFDVLDTVAPSSGIFDIRLAKRGSAGIGLTISATGNKGFIVCDINRGSAAHRAGSLIAGDRLLEINDIPLSQCTADDISQILSQSNGLITLKIERYAKQNDNRSKGRVTCTVEMQPFGGPIGITIAGSEEPFEPITISGLTLGGLAEQTGLLQIGDEILAINDHSLHGEPLSTAHALLQSSPNKVALKILRTIPKHERALESVSPNLPSSIDSAVESWGGSYFDLTQSPDVRSYQTYPNHLNIDHTISPSNQVLNEITKENLQIRKQLEILSSQMNGETPLSPVGLRRQMPTGSHAEMNTLISSGSSNTLEDANGYPADAFPQPTTEVEGRSSEYEGIDTRGSCVEFEGCEMNNLQDTRQWQYLNASQPSIRSEFRTDHLLKIQLNKDPVYEDFGFSVSDGLYERGVFINRIRKGGPADLNNILQQFDRILKVNETCTQDFDCCLTVPLIASAGETLTLLIARPKINSQSSSRIDHGGERHHGMISNIFAPGINDGRRIIV